jgi:hypothetical protein
MKILDGNRSRLTVLLATAGLAATGAQAAMAFAPTIQPGGQAIAKGTHVSCQVAATTVLCTKAGGLSATLSTSGVTRVAKGAAPLQASGKVLELAPNAGFIIRGGGTLIYCHVYVEGERILSCASNGGNEPGDRGFDISDRSIVLFRIDAAGIRRDLKTYEQPSDPPLGGEAHELGPLVA